MARKIIKFTSLFLLVLIAGVSVATMLRQHLTYEAPYPAITASKDLVMIERGKNLVMVTHGCVQCHSPVQNVDSVLKMGQEPSLAGNKKVETPFGTIFTTNLTPDVKTGIGSMTDAEIARVLRYGVKKNGEAVLPFMQGQNMNDEELTAVISYLRSVKPIENKVPDHEFTLLGKFARAFVLKPSLPEKTKTLAKN
ncbi:c-type cytochrome [Rufibacter hautae]|uniref:Cytochrome c n=1 Tax=Rufibacter hautae TaxID=2595005 RepID=A0A5B6TD70_9BACT|nr:c-type cytochrome [Rufibacter hautae]KAA3438409.1 cytochrome c [Rufibacter hautae]